MPTTIDLSQASVDQVQDFLNSFDVVLSDCDGVIWHLGEPIPGALTTVKKLQELGKRLYLVTNNSTISAQNYCEKLRLRGLDVNTDQIISTVRVITWYLKKMHFSGEAFVIASPAFRKTLMDGGIKLAPENLKVVEEDVGATLRAIHDRPSVKAVIVDFSLFFDWTKIAFSISCLNRDDVLYICGTQDEWVTCGPNKKVLGAGPLINIITKHSGRTPIECAKPSKILKDFVLKLCHVNPKNCLFIGDTIKHDMKFASMCGFRKLFVNTGIDKITDADGDEDAKPDFYIPSLGMLYGIIRDAIDSMHNKSTNNKDDCCNFRQ